MAKKLTDLQPNRAIVNKDYPLGKAIDSVTDGDGVGTQYNADLINEYCTGVYGAILHEAGMTPNGVVDTEDASQLVDAVKKIIRDQKKPVASLDFTRSSEAYDQSRTLLPVDTPATYTFNLSNEAFYTLNNLDLDDPVDPNETVPNYDDAVALIKSYATKYSTEGLEYEDLCSTYRPLASGSGREQPTLSYKADDDRPIIFVQIATHGNETHPLKGFLRFVDLWFNSIDLTMQWARKNLAFMAVCIHNPDGWALQRRRNGTDDSSIYNGINLNRNWDYFWDYAADPDKGATPFSEVENLNLKDWMEKNNRIDNGVFFIDFHMWFSRTIYGFLTDHMFPHGMEGQSLNRSFYNFANTLIAQRDYSGYTVANGLENFVYSERASSRKPYAPYWSVQRFKKYKGNCAQIEVPQSESQAVNSLVVGDTLHAMLLAVKDHLTAQGKLGVVVDPDVPEANIVNQNSNLETWSGAELRPTWVRTKGLILQNNNNKADTFRPISSAWPETVRDHCVASYLDPSDEKKSFFMTVGGSTSTGNLSNRTYVEMFLPPEPPAVGSNMYGIYKPSIPQDRITDFPERISQAAMTYCNGYFYLFGGLTDESPATYNNIIYRIPVVDDMNTAGWETVKTSTVYPNGLSRHSMLTIGNKVVIFGGKEPADYNRNVVVFDPSDNSETLLAEDLNYKNGWFCLHQLPSDEKIVYLFGGWQGSALKDDTWKLEFLADASDFTITRVADMPRARRAMACGGNDERIIVIGGDDVEEDKYSSDIFEYDIVNDVWKSMSPDPLGGSEFLYTYDDELSDEEEPFDLTKPDTTKSVGVYNPYTEMLYKIGGLKVLPDGENQRVDSVFEFSFVDESLTARKINDVSWGYYRLHSSQDLGGDQVTCIMSVTENAQDWVQRPESVKVNPYQRPCIYVGNDFSSTDRWRNKYMVTPIGQTVTLPVYAPVTNQGSPRVYGYHRQYGEDTKTTLSGFQVIKDRLPTPRLCPLTGMARENATFNITAQSAYLRCAYVAMLNNRFAEELTVAHFEGDTYSIKVVHDFSSGKLKVKTYADPAATSETGSYDLLDVEPNADLYTNILKRDIINLRVRNQGALFIEAWFYGRKGLVSLPANLDLNTQKIHVNPEPTSKTGIYFLLETRD